jgi:hypothetical protein
VGRRLRHVRSRRSGVLPDPHDKPTPEPDDELEDDSENESKDEPEDEDEPQDKADTLYFGRENRCTARSC